MTEMHIMCHQNAEELLKLLPGFSSQSTASILKSFNGYHLFTAGFMNTNACRSPAGTNMCEIDRYHTMRSSGEFGNSGGLERMCAASMVNCYSPFVVK